MLLHYLGKLISTLFMQRGLVLTAPCTLDIRHVYRTGGAENAGVENAGVENAGVDSSGGKCRSGKSRSDNVWKAVRTENS